MRNMLSLREVDGIAYLLVNSICLGSALFCEFVSLCGFMRLHGFTRQTGWTRSRTEIVYLDQLLDFLELLCDSFKLRDGLDAFFLVVIELVLGFRRVYLNALLQSKYAISPQVRC